MTQPPPGLVVSDHTGPLNPPSPLSSHSWPERGENSPESYPVFEPLFSGVSHGDILIDLDFFPNAQKGTYWTSMTAKDNPSLAYAIPFFFGGSVVREKSLDTHIRLVRSAD